MLLVNMLKYTACVSLKIPCLTLVGLLDFRGLWSSAEMSSQGEMSVFVELFFAFFTQNKILFYDQIDID